MSKHRARNRSSSCRGKVRYHDHAQAVRALRRVSNGSRRERKPRRTYFCATCNGWHLTSWRTHPGGVT